LFKSKQFLDIYVGEGKVPWTLTRDFLRDRIPSLYKAIATQLKGITEDTSSSQILIKDVEPAVFAMALDWLLTGKLQCLKPHDASVATQGHFGIWCALHVFSEGFNLAELSTASINQLKKCLSRTHWIPSSTVIRYVFEKTPEVSLLREIVAAEVTNAFIRQPLHQLKEQAEEWASLVDCHPEFHAQMLVTLKVQLTQKETGAKPPISRELGAKCKRVEDEEMQPQGRSGFGFVEVIDLTGDS
jgi:hypothetical protein